MPYFRRGPLAESIVPATAPSPEQTEATIVEKAAAILDRETAVAAGPPLGETGDVLAPISGLTDLGDLPGRLSEALASLLNAFAQSAPPARSEQGGLAKALPFEPVATVPVVQPRSAVRAGDTASLELPLYNDGAGPASVALYNTDFVSDTGHQIPSAQATFSPRTLALLGHGRDYSKMQVAIPAQCAPGSYSALVQAMGLGRPCAVVILQVE